jgi:RNA binding exosome subunit
MTLTAELKKKITTEMENKYFLKFEKQISYLGNGVYSIPNKYLFY